MWYSIIKAGSCQDFRGKFLENPAAEADWSAGRLQSCNPQEAAQRNPAKAKANAAQGLPELLKIATNEVYEDNRKEKHSKDAKYGWYSYDSRFALPVFSDDGEIERYNAF